MRYFDHDTTAHKDELIQALRLECGGAAVDAYWAIVECIYRDETDLVLGANRPETKSVTHWLCTDYVTLESYIEAMGEVGLLTVAENEDGSYTLHSERASENIAAYQQRSKTARQNGKKGGRKPNANQWLTETEPNPNPTLTQPLAKEKEKEKEKIIGSSKEEPVGQLVCDVVAYLNERTGSSYRPTTKRTASAISARASEGYSLDDFKAVIDAKSAEWGDDRKMSKYLRPETLFRPQKFEAYLNEARREVSRHDEFAEYAD